MKPGRLLVAILVGIVFSLPLCGYLSLLVAERSIDSQYPDFRHFQTPNDLKEYLETNLTVDEATLAEVEVFMQGLGIDNCFRWSDHNFDQTEPSDVEYDFELLCSALAPEVEYESYEGFDAIMMRIFTLWTYDITFEFHQDRLASISVRYTEMSL